MGVATPPRRAVRVRRAVQSLRPSVERLDADGRASVVGHLEELRTRVLLVLAALLVAFGLFYARRDALFEVLARPLDDRWPLQTLGVTEPFFTALSVCAQAAFVVTTPLLAWHAWRFVRPAIDPAARRTVGALLLVAPALFTTGVLFGYAFVLGPAVRILLGLGPDSIEVVVRASDYYSFVATTLLAIGVAFCFPLVLLGLARVGIIDSARLRSSRKVALVLIIVLAAMLPTADPVSLAIEVLPLLALYELSIVAVRVQERAIRRREAGAGAGADELDRQHSRTTVGGA